MKAIPGYENYYMATEDGKIFSIRSNKFLTPNIGKDGYHRIHFTVNGKSKYYLLHRLIALTFIPNVENKPTVDHINKDKNNNSVSNLRWATSSEQVYNEDTTIVHSKEHIDKMVECSKIARQKRIEQRDINNPDKVLNTFCSAVEAAEVLFNDTSKAQRIRGCARGETKTSYGFIWRYIE